MSEIDRNTKIHCFAEFTKNAKNEQNLASQTPNVP